MCSGLVMQNPLKVVGCGNNLCQTAVSSLLDHLMVIPNVLFQMGEGIYYCTTVCVQCLGRDPQGHDFRIA